MWDVSDNEKTEQSKTVKVRRALSASDSLHKTQKKHPDIFEKYLRIEINCF